MSTCGLAPDCAVCCRPECPHDYILEQAPLEEYLAWRAGERAYQEYLDRRERAEYGIEEDDDD